MAKDLFNYLTTKPGRERRGPATRSLTVSPEEGKDVGLPASVPAHVLETVDLGLVATAGGPAATDNRFAFTTDGAGSVSNGPDGYVLTTGATSGNKVVVRHLRRLSSARAAFGKYRLALGTVANSTATVGFFNSSTDPVGTAPTNGVFFVITNGAVVGRVRGASGTAADTGTLITLTDGASVELDIRFTRGGLGSFFVNGVETKMTGAQLTQSAAITGDLYHHYHVQATSGSARTLQLDYGWAGYDR